MKNQPELVIIGAGPGDPELITLKAINILKKPMLSYMIIL